MKVTDEDRARHPGAPWHLLTEKQQELTLLKLNIGFAPLGPEREAAHQALRDWEAAHPDE